MDETEKRLKKLRRDLDKAQARSTQLAEARLRMTPDAFSRARVTTANARWMRAAEERDRLLKEISDLEASR